MKTISFALISSATLWFAGSPTWAEVSPIAGVNFEAPGSTTTFDTAPDDYDLSDGIAVSSGSGGALFNGWTLTLLNGNPGAGGNLRNDGGANAAGATSPNFPARLEGNRLGSWSITIDPGVLVSIDRIEFDVRGATNGQGRDGQFTTSLEAPGTYLWEDFNLIGRTSPNSAPNNWLNVGIDLTANVIYQNLTNQTLDFIWRTPGGAIDLDTIQVFATIGVPEPTTVVPLGLGIAGLIFRRRKRTKR